MRTLGLIQRELVSKALNYYSNKLKQIPEKIKDLELSSHAKNDLAKYSLELAEFSQKITAHEGPFFIQGYEKKIEEAVKAYQKNLEDSEKAVKQELGFEIIMNQNRSEVEDCESLLADLKSKEN